jgi:hypothetical protein
MTRRQVRALVHTAREQEVVRAELGVRDPGGDGLAGLAGRQASILSRAGAVPKSRRFNVASWVAAA